MIVNCLFDFNWKCLCFPPSMSDVKDFLGVWDDKKNVDGWCDTEKSDQSLTILNETNDYDEIM